MAETLQQEILSGKYPLGSQLPPDREIASYFNVAYLTARNAVGLLAKKGMVSRRHGYGTFVQAVTEKLLIGILFGPSLAEESAYFYRSVLKAIKEQSGDSRWSFRVYDGLTDLKGAPQPPDAPLYRQFRADLKNYDFRGLIVFSLNAPELAQIKECLTLPKVQFVAPRVETDLVLDYYRFGNESVKFLAGTGRRKIAYLRTMAGSDEGTADLDGVMDAVHDLGLPPVHLQNMDATLWTGREEREICEQTLAFIQRWQKADENRPFPDGLVVSDDIAMRAVALALLQSGVKVPEQLQVVSLANDGIKLHYGIPVVRYEFSTKQIAHALLDVLSKRMVGEPLPPLPVMIGGRLVPAER